MCKQYSVFVIFCYCIWTTCVYSFELISHTNRSRNPNAISVGGQLECVWLTLPHIVKAQKGVKISNIFLVEIRLFVFIYEKDC